ncbi:MAG: hypothetical protein MJ137_07850 [Clostridia bacterium]|nr:hypothetical protein [Clostridia bacterium]
MKKFFVMLLALSMLLAICIPATAAEKAIDITDSIKVATYIEMMDKKLKIVRDDAYLMGAMDYTNDTSSADWKAPGTGVRTLSVVDTKGWTNYYNDLDFLIDAADDSTIFAYPCIWSNITGPMTYEFAVDADGIYEFVVLGCAQIKDSDVDNDAKDRGFCVSVDGGQKYQVNISDTKGVFRNYTYDLTYETAMSDEIKTTNGTNTSNFIMGYYYGIEIELKAGKHQFEYWGLEYSGAEDHSQKTSSRLNYAGAYVQKALTDAELETYVYPEVTTEEVTTKEITTKALTTAAPEPTAEPTTAPADVTTATPAGDTTAAPAPAKKGCGSVIGAGVALFAVLGTALVFKKRF